MKLGAQTQVVTGRLVGSGANEPAWSDEQLQHFSSLRSLKLPVVKCMDTRKALEDGEGKYVVRNLDGTSSATTAAILPTLPFSEFKIGIGDAKPDDKLPKKKLYSKKLYSDVVIIGKDDSWVLNQWVVQNVIMEPVPSGVRNSVGTGRGGAGSRKVGVHFARFGFPAESLAPVFHTLDSTVNGIINSLIMTDGYYWCNASWGISHTPGTFVYITENNTRAHTSQLSEAMDMLGTKSSQGVGTFAISLGCEYDKEGDRIIPNSAKYAFSIKCHSFVHFRKTDYYGPPQTASVGALMSNDMMMMAEPLSKCALPILPPEHMLHQFRTSKMIMARSRASSRRSASTRDKEKELNPIVEWAAFRPDVDRVELGFVGCSAARCSTTSARAEYDAMMLRIGMSTCCKHIMSTEVESRIATAMSQVDDFKMTIVFYDLELSKDGQIEQLSAFTDTGENFSVYMRTTVRTNTSPNLRALPPMLYNALASEPMDAMKRFNSWIKLMHSMNTNGDTNMDNVILAAHFGSCHDHVHLLRTMMRWGITPPEYRFSDTLALFKVMKGMNQRANLPTLVAKYAAWLQHTPHDADSDARVLRAVVMCVFPMVKKACYAFSTSHDGFMKRSGLNMHGIRPVYTFKDIDINTDPDLDSVNMSDDSLE
jgi:hypothetical protein